MFPNNPIGYDPMFAAQMPDSYSNPLNFGAYGVNPAQAGWNVNSSYLTPSFMAGYRPGYMGQQNMGMPPMGFGRSAVTAFPSPIQPNAPMYVDPLRYRQRAGNEFSSYLADGPMAIAQIGGSVAIGLAIQGAVDSLRIPGGSQKHLRSAAYNYRMAAPSFLGGSATSAHAAYLARSQTLLEAGGHYLGAGLGRGVGHGISGAVRVGSLGLVGGIPGLGKLARTAGAFAGAAAGSILAPFALGTAAMEVANQGLFTPYTAGRQASTVFGESMDGTYTGMGLSTAPMGISASYANKLGFSAARAISDQTFDHNAAAPMVGYGMQAGLYKNVAFNKDAILGKTREIAQGVKVMMEVFNDPSIQDAVQRLGQLANTGGLTKVSGISALGRSYSVASAITGIGTRELMDTHGQQGQMMYNQAGLVPYLGQFAAMSSVSGMAAAQRMGLISSASLASLGGIGGASQLSLQGQLGLARSPFSMMSAFTQEALGAGKQGIIGTLGSFGNYAASNPVEAYGSYLLNGREALSTQLSKDPMAFLSGIQGRADMIPGIRGSNGRYSANGIAALMSAQGVEPEQIRALLTQLRTANDPKTRTYMEGADKAAQQASYAAMLERSNLTHYGRGVGIGNLSYLYNYYKVGAQNAVSEGISQPIGGALASVADWFNQTDYVSGNVRDLSGSNYSGLTTGADWDVRRKRAGSSSVYNPRLQASYAKGKNLPSDHPYRTSKLFNQLVPLPNDISTRLEDLSFQSASNPKLRAALSRSASPSTMDLGVVASAMGGDLDSAREILTYHASQGTDRGTTDDPAYEQLIKRARNSLIGAVEMRFKGVTGELGYSSRSFSLIQDRLKSLTGSEMSVISGFAQLNLSALNDDASFLTALQNEHAGGTEMKELLYKLGFREAFEGKGEKSESLLKQARQLVAAAASSFVENRESRILGSAAAYMLQSGGSKTLRMDRKTLNKGLAKVVGAVERSTLGSKSGMSAKAGTGEIISQASGMMESIQKAMSSEDSYARKFGGQIDFGGMMEAAAAHNGAALKLEKAADHLMTAATTLNGGKGPTNPSGVSADGAINSTTDSTISAKSRWSMTFPELVSSFK